MFLCNMLIKDYNPSVTPLLHSTNHHIKVSFISLVPFFSPQELHSISVKYS